VGIVRTEAHGSDGSAEAGATRPIRRGGVRRDALVRANPEVAERALADVANPPRGARGYGELLVDLKATGQIAQGRPKKGYLRGIVFVAYAGRTRHHLRRAHELARVARKVRTGER